jgi:hypothetical protein
LKCIKVSFNCGVDEMVGEVFYEKCLFAIMHTLYEVKIKAIVVDYIEVWFLHLIKEGKFYISRSYHKQLTLIICGS